MIFRNRTPASTVWRRFRSGLDGFTFDEADGHFEARVAANAERVVDLFYTLSEHLAPAIDVVIEDQRSEATWNGEGVALPDIRDAVARLKVPLATYGGVEITLYSPEDQLTLTPQLEFYIYSRNDKWLYLLQGKGMEQRTDVAEKNWGSQSWDRSAAPSLTSAVASAAERLSLQPA